MSSATTTSQRRAAVRKAPFQRLHNEVNKVDQTRQRISVQQCADFVLIWIALPVDPSENSAVLFEVEYPSTYPLHPPSIRCLNSADHWDVDVELCKSSLMLGQGYEPSTTVDQVVSVLQRWVESHRESTFRTPAVVELKTGEAHTFDLSTPLPNAAPAPAKLNPQNAKR